MPWYFARRAQMNLFLYWYSRGAYQTLSSQTDKSTLHASENEHATPNTLLVPTPETARHVSCCFRGRRGTSTRWALRVIE